jgi:3-deoxy-manno-octulosonate cytidylyltransferase (CMP-KDO synthetase)
LSSFWAVIPARRASSRLPNKPLADIAGRPMVVRVAERAQRSHAQRVIVATDCAEIQQAVIAHGHECVLTRVDHPSGTDRIAEVAHHLSAGPDQIIVNVQGDEPLIDPDMINQVANCLFAAPHASVSTAATPITDNAALASPHVVKVVCNAESIAMYFSRAPIPYQRDRWPSLPAVHYSPELPPALRHIGIYGFRAKALGLFPTWPVCPPEAAEQLEQLRWLWNGHHIAVWVSPAGAHAGVDTPEDLERVRKLWPGSL